MCEILDELFDLRSQNCGQRIEATAAWVKSALKGIAAVGAKRTFGEIPTSAKCQQEILLGYREDVRPANGMPPGANSQALI
jgi:hypothetical protein